MQMRYVLILVCAMASAVGNGLAQAAVKIQHWVAPSGARVYFVENHDLPMLDVQVDFAAGAAFDDPARPGVASLTHALLDAGAGKLDEHAIADRFADTGAQISGDFDSDRASLKLRVLSAREQRDPALDLLRLIIAEPRYDARVLTRERARMIAELRESLTRPDTLGARRFGELAYGGHPYGRNSSEAALAKITREQVLAFHRSRYVAAASAVTLVGDLSRAEAEAIAQQLTGGLPRGAMPAPLPAPAAPQAVVARIPHPATQAHVTIGQPGIRRGDPDFFPLVVGNYVLGGGGFVSRLLKVVRDDNGYAYSAYSYFMPLLAAGPFEIGLQTKVEQADQAVAVARKVVEDYLRDGPTEAELQAAKDNLVNGFALRLDNNRKVLEQVAVIGFYGLPLDYLDAYPARVRAVTVAEVRDAFARRVKPQSLVTVIVGGKAPDPQK